MKISISILLRLFCLCIFWSCQSSKADNLNQDSLIIIDLQPFKGVSKTEQIFIANEIKKVYPHAKLLASIELPKSAFYAKRNRYRADSLIRYLSRKTPKGHITIGLTANDISTTKDEIPDWGVMGLGFCPGVACIASSFRLSKKDRQTQFFKISIHELGHTQGLPHCPEKYCFMRDAEGRNPTNEEKDFCQNCKSFLNRKGWDFK
jgi:archaemetzincin